MSLISINNNKSKQLLHQNHCFQRSKLPTELPNVGGGGTL